MQSALKGRFPPVVATVGGLQARTPPLVPATAEGRGASMFAGFPVSPGPGTVEITVKMLTSSPPSLLGHT